MAQTITQDLREIVEKLSNAGEYNFERLLKKCHVDEYFSPFGFSTFFHKPTHTTLIFENNFKTNLKYKCYKLFELKEIVKNKKINERKKHEF